MKIRDKRNGKVYPSRTSIGECSYCGIPQIYFECATCGSRIYLREEHAEIIKEPVLPEESAGDVVKELEEVRERGYDATTKMCYERILSQIAVVMENISACGNCVAGQDCDHCDCVERDAKARRIIKAIKGVKG